MIKSNTISKRLLSFKFAFRGLSILIRNEQNAWIHLAMGTLAIALGFYLEISNLEWIAVVLCIGMVLSAETFNTAIEHIANFIQPKRDKNIEQIKDLAAGGVLLVAISSFLVGLIIFLPKIITLISH